jgi:hypothetical protein
MAIHPFVMPFPLCLYSSKSPQFISVFPHHFLTSIPYSSREIVILPVRATERKKTSPID